MPDLKRVAQVMSESLLLERLERSNEMREFFIQMWLQNPALARQGGAKVREIIAPFKSPTSPDELQQRDSVD
jgi:hypothetical protein